MNTERVRYYSYARAVSCIAIVFVHVISQGISRFSGSMGSANIAYWSVLNNLKWGVPIFMMITGSLLLEETKELPLKKLFTGYILRVVKALIFFCLVFALLEVIFISGGEKSAGRVFLEGVSAIFTGQGWAHLWYLYALIGIYLLLPFYKMVAAHASKTQMQYLLGVYIAFLSILPFVTGWDIRIGFYIHVSSIYPFWLFFGYYMKKWGFRKRTGCYLACFLVSAVLLVLVTFVRWRYGIAPLDRLFNFSSILVIAQTYGIAGVIHAWNVKKEGLADKILLKLDSASFGIYLIHMIPIWTAYTVLGWDPFTHGGFWGILLPAVLSLAFAWAVTAGLKKCPFFRNVL